MLKYENNMEKCHCLNWFGPNRKSPTYFPLSWIGWNRQKNPPTSARSHPPRLDLAEWLEHLKSHHPPAQWNLRGGRWSSVEYSTWEKKYKKSSCLKKTISHCCPFNETSRSLSLAPTSKNSCSEVNSTLSSKTECSCTVFLYLSYLFSPVFVHFKATVANRHQSQYFEVRESYF